MPSTGEAPLSQRDNARIACITRGVARFCMMPMIALIGTAAVMEVARAAEEPDQREIVLERIDL